MFSLLTLLSGILTFFMPVFPAFVVMWWLVGTILTFIVVENHIFLLPKVGVAAVANFTVAFVWTIELGTGKWKVGSVTRRSDGINIVTNIDR